MSEPCPVGNPLLPILNTDARPWEARVGIAFFRFQSRIERRMTEVLAVHGLTLAQYDVLATLWGGEGITQQELAERLLVTKGNVVGLIDRVSSAGFVERRPDPDDRRVNRLYLTDAGHTILSAASPAQHALARRVFGRLSEDELQQLHGFLRRLEDGAAC